MNEAETRHLRLLLALALGSIVVGGTVDLVVDRPQSWLSFHVLFELFMLAGALVMATTLWLGWWRAERSLSEARRGLESRRAQAEVWRESARRALEGLARAIDEQFVEWGLTEAERDVAIRLLKGHSFKRIARETDRSERTARQHAAAIYRKAELSGRAELSAFFLEDLMLPDPARHAVHTEIL